MPESRTMSLLLMSFIMLSGCATKNYGHLEPIAAETVAADCAALDAQLAETGKFRAQVQQASEFSGADVLAFLIDFGIGNAIQKSAALRSADEREQTVREQQAKLGCPAAGVLRAHGGQ
ncbi:MAG TPA: hypothetical protein VNT02_06135 [Burkholderiales bacterium]|nr:hypothetical protein [Burkholderiales bacterium]